MNEVASSAAQQAAAAPAGPDYSFFLMMGIVFLIFYLLVMRPQQKQQKEREKAIRGALKGDHVVTTGGLHGVVSGVTDDVLSVEIARVKGGARVEVQIDRARIESVTRAGKSVGKSGGKSAKEAKQEGGEA